jgi:hypothetical protein
MDAIFESVGKKIYDINGHKGYAIKWISLTPYVKKWSYNREPDLKRVEELIIHHLNGGYIPPLIHLAEMTGEGIVCYDGNHRREAFNYINDKEFVCIVDVMFSATHSDVYKSFNNINKSVQLPAIYIDELDDTCGIKTEIIQLVMEYEMKYKPFVSTSSRCHAPQFNRDSFIDNIYNIYMSFSGTVTIKQLNEIFSMLNIEYQNGRMCRPHECYKKIITDKCRKYNFWLFIEKIIPLEHVTMLLSKFHR